MAALDASASFDASAIAKAQDETLAEAERLNLLPAPEKTPFENKYAARKLLQERCEVLQAALPGAGTTTPWIRALLGECEAALGDIGYDVEEPHAADPCYARALAALAPGAEALDDSGDHGDEDASEEARIQAAAADEETAEDIAVASAARVRDAALVGAPKHARGAELGAAALRALNGAAVLWQGREQPRRAFRLLKAAEALERLPSLPGGAGFSADTLREAETKTIYYLAQVCASLGDGAASANYCAQTLERQLVGPAPSFDGVTPLDWAKNCVGLARFFVDQGAVLDAMSCCRAGVAAARLDGVDDDPDEPRGSVVADAHKCWAQAHASRAESFIATRRTVGWLSILAEVEDGAAPPKPPAATLAADFRSLGAPERSPDLVDGIGGDLRLAFRAALRALRRARSYYVLDGFVTEHVDLARLESTCWKLVSLKEPDYARLQQMRRRRVACLDPLRDALQADAYRDLRATLGYEVAQVLAAIVEAKAERLRRYSGQALRERQQALEALKDRTCDVFDDFLKQCAGDARTQPGDTPRSAIERLAESDVEAYMNAQFVAARLRGKRFVAIPGDVRHAEDSLRRYKQCVADAAAAKKARNLPEDFFARELDLCKQMIHLLPTKIHHVRTTGGVLEDF